MAIFPETTKAARWVVAPAAVVNGACSATRAAPAAGQCHYLFGFSASLSTGTATALLTITFGATVVYRRFVTGGVDLNFSDSPIPVGDSLPFTVSLAAGGSGVSGVVAVWGDTSIPPN